MIRIAKSCKSIDKTLHFYQDILNLKLVIQFEDHQGFSGIVFSLQDNVQLEFTKYDRQEIPPATNEEDLIILYENNPIEFAKKKQSLLSKGVQFIDNLNPYWNEQGATFLDPNGYRLVVSEVKK